MAVGGAALMTDHVWLLDQRDTLKAAADAGGVAATLALNRRLDADPTVTDAALEAELKAVARRYVLLNLRHLAKDRLERAESTLVLEVIRAAIDEIEGMVQSTLADLAARTDEFSGAARGTARTRASRASCAIGSDAICRRWCPTGARRRSGSRGCAAST